jgi:hypothetical protein
MIAALRISLFWRVQRMREMDAQQEQRATERVNNYRQQQQR